MLTKQYLQPNYSYFKPFANEIFMTTLGNNWSGIRLMANEGRKERKVPTQPNGYNAKSDTPATWSNFADVVTAWGEGKFANLGHNGFVGIAMESRHNIVCVDFDNIADMQTVTSLVQKFNSYTTLSASGKGIHVWGTVDNADKVGYHKGVFSNFEVEVFSGLNSEGSGGRFITETFQIANCGNGSTSIRNITLELARLLSIIGNIAEAKVKSAAKPIDHSKPSYDKDAPLSDKAMEASLASHCRNIIGAAKGNSHATIRSSIKVWIDDYKRGKISGAQLDIIKQRLSDAAMTRQGQIEEFEATWRATMS